MIQSLYQVWMLLFITGCVCVFDSKTSKPTFRTNDSCFCELFGKVDDCCCNIKDVERLNNYQIYPKLQNLVRRNYFRYIKYIGRTNTFEKNGISAQHRIYLNDVVHSRVEYRLLQFEMKRSKFCLKLSLHRKCEYWPDFHQCALKDCSVDKCSEDEIPKGFLVQTKKHATGKGDQIKISVPCSIGKEQSIGNLDHSISNVQIEYLKDWSKHDSSISFCADLEEDIDDADWIDLLLNPEQYTGYSGESPHRIWNSIYKENCFLPEKELNTYDDFKSKFLTKTCLEKRVFYRLVSGLHASINTHLSYKYLLSDPMLPTKPKWGPNLEEFEKRFSPSTTQGRGPHWLKNIYFAYLLTLRAVTVAAPYWEKMEFYTGNTKEDFEVKQLVLELIKSSKTCPSTFDESLMFNSDEASKLKVEFRQHYHNVTKIMDCVGCEKCRLWGKLQTSGIGTALKILFSFETWHNIPTVNGRKFSLTRSEVVTLFNALNKLSESVFIMNQFKKLSEVTRTDL